MSLKRTPYVCQTCGTKKVRDHSALDEPLTREWTARCISGTCRGNKRKFFPAKRPLTGNYR